MNELTKEWLNHAKKDLLVVEKILDDENLTNIIAFHSQQCIEKVFKSILIFYTGEIPRIHNLLKLYGMISEYEKIDVDLQSLKRINETYIDSRYPSDLGLLPNGQPSLKTVKEFYNTAKEVFQQVKSKINSKIKV
jgi:HEPN domain-containing protein